MTYKVYFSLGSNLGDRQGNLSAAIEMMDSSFGVHFSRISSVIETESWGFDAPDFLNCAVLYELSLKAHDILLICKDIERSMGRKDIVEFDNGGKRIYHSRTIDIDILLYGDETVDLPDLKIPHPLMYQRPFVMGPLNEIIDR